MGFLEKYVELWWGLRVPAGGCVCRYVEIHRQISEFN